MAPRLVDARRMLSAVLRLHGRRFASELVTATVGGSAPFLWGRVAFTDTGRPSQAVPRLRCRRVPSDVVHGHRERLRLSPDGAASGGRLRNGTGSAAAAPPLPVFCFGTGRPVHHHRGRQSPSHLGGCCVCTHLHGLAGSAAAAPPARALLIRCPLICACHRGRWILFLRRCGVWRTPA